jgi:secreted trypsin-like serine protease
MMSVSKIARGRIAAGMGALALVGAGVVATSAPAGAIADGASVSKGRYGFSVKLTMTGIPNADGTTRNSACSGALVAPSWVITAGHCFRDVNGNPVSRPVAALTTATVGRTDTTDTTTGHVVTVVAVKQATNGADVALAKLASPVTDVTPVGLSSVAPSAGKVVRLTGYGATSDVNPVPSHRLQTGTFTVTAFTTTTVSVTALAPHSDTSACAYDSGGPYFKQSGSLTYLVSVESNGPSCPHTSAETTARTDNLVLWIKSTVGAKAS